MCFERILFVFFFPEIGKHFQSKLYVSSLKVLKTRLYQELAFKGSRTGGKRQVPGCQRAQGPIQSKPLMKHVTCGKGLVKPGLHCVKGFKI